MRKLTNKLIFKTIDINNFVLFQTFPVLYALMDSKLQVAYSALFQYMKNVLVPNMQVQLFISDFETALMSALAENFPNTAISGCWFHYAKVGNSCIMSIGFNSSKSNTF